MIKYLYITFTLFVCNSATSQQLSKLYPDILYNNIANKIGFESKSTKLSQLKAFDQNGKKINLKYSISDSNTVSITPINLNQNITIQFLGKKEILLSKNFNVIELPAPSLYFNIAQNHAAEDEDYFNPNNFLIDSLISNGTANDIELYMNSNIFDIIKPNVMYTFMPNNSYLCKINKWNIEHEPYSKTIIVSNLVTDSKINFNELKQYFTEDNVSAISIMFKGAKYLIKYDNDIKKEFTINEDFQITIFKNKKGLNYYYKGIIED